MASAPSNIGRYEIVKAIGHGGMGSLYLAWDAKLDRAIAIKVLNEDSEDLRERFAREAKSAARLRHPHIVTIFDLGEHEGRPYIAMEYIHGRTLAQMIRERDDMTLARALELMAELCDGLAFAHKAGIIHRDVKPANIMVDEEGALKILDFGIARLAESTGMTQAGMMIGTLNYMSPEQVTGVSVDHRSDIFAVGLVFYELLTQKAAFPGTLSTGILSKLLHSEPEPLALARPGLDEDVIRIVGRAIEKDANHRYQDLTQMRREILTVRGRVETADVRTRERDTPVPHVPPTEPPPERRASDLGKQPTASAMPPPEAQPAPPGAGKKIAIAAVAVALLAAAAYWLGPFRSGAPTQTTSNAQPVITPQSQVPAPIPTSAAAPAPASPSPPTDPHVTRANELVREGQRLLGESKLGEARTQFQQAQALAATAAARDGLAEIDRRQGEYTRLWAQGAAAVRRKQIKEALSKFLGAKAIDPEAFDSGGGPDLVGRLQSQLSASTRDQSLSSAAAGEAKKLQSLREVSIDRFNEGRTLEQQRRYDSADAKYREALGADKDNKQAAAALSRSEQYRKARADGLAAFKASDRDGTLHSLGEARSINSGRFLADGLDKTVADAERLGVGRSLPPAEPAPASAPTDDKSAIVAVVRNLARALSTQTNSSHNVNEVRKFWPGAGSDAFGDNESQTYLLGEPVFVVLAADKASVDCDRRRLTIPRSTGKTSIAYDNVRIELRKANGSWQVVSITDRSK